MREASIDLCRTRVDEQSTLEALRQLSQRNFDAKKLQDDVSNRVFQVIDANSKFKFFVDELLIEN